MEHEGAAMRQCVAGEWPLVNPEGMCMSLCRYCMRGRQWAVVSA